MACSTSLRRSWLMRSFTREVTATDGLGIEVVFTLTVSVVTP